MFYYALVVNLELTNDGAVGLGCNLGGDKHLLMEWKVGLIIVIFG
jgi:hypothetical protein